MSTNISTAFDAAKTLMAATFTTSSGYYQLADPYNVVRNSVASLSKGWGITLNSGQNTNRALSNQMSLKRTVSLVLTRRRYANELDPASKESAEKSIFEDQFTLVRAIESDGTLGGAGTGISKFNYIGDNGIESVVQNEIPFIKLISEFELEYFESLIP